MDTKVTWRRKVIRIVNAVIRPSAIRLVRASSLDEHLARGYYEIMLDGRTFRCDPYHAGFWAAVEEGRWEPDLFAVLRRFLTPASVYYDIGAWIGPTTLYASQRCRAVYAFEPDPLACAWLLQNITNNELAHVRALNVAVAPADGIGAISNLTGLGDSTSRVGPPGHEHEFQCPITAVTLDTILTRLSCEPPTFIKMDIEGGEFDLLPAIRCHLERLKPTLHLSLHARSLPNEHRSAKLHALVDALEGYASALVNDQPLSITTVRETLLSWDYSLPDDFGPLLLLPRS